VTPQGDAPKDATTFWTNPLAPTGDESTPQDLSSVVSRVLKNIEQALVDVQPQIDSVRRSIAAAQAVRDFWSRQGFVSYVGVPNGLCRSCGRARQGHDDDECARMLGESLQSLVKGLEGLERQIDEMEASARRLQAGIESRLLIDRLRST
jgi:hypothetical protein